MKRFNVFILSALAILSFLSAQQAQVTNVIASQRTDGSQLVDITYDLTEDALFNRFTVSVEVSFDNGDTYIESSLVTGDVGNYIAPGIGNHIIWDLGQEYNEIFSEDVKVRVIATGHIVGEMPFEFVTIPAGDYTFGFPPIIYNIDYDYEIMKYPVTNTQYAQFLIEAYGNGQIFIQDGSIYSSYSGDEQYIEGDYLIYNMENDSGEYNYGTISWNGTTFIVTEGYGTHPVINVTWFGAYIFGDYYGLRLPTEYEWEKAARGDTGWDFTCEPYDLSGDGSQANSLGSGDPWDNGTTPVGFYNGENYEGYQTTDCSSPYDAYDMAGNVWEWLDSWSGTSNRLTVGGSWMDINQWMLRPYSRSESDPSNGSNTRGFRCCRTLSE